jgi:hypothetical protein
MVNDPNITIFWAVIAVQMANDNGLLATRERLGRGLGQEHEKGSDSRG